MDAFVARQPVFDNDHSVFGYELFFRSSLCNAAEIPEGQSPSSRLIADGTFLGLIEAMSGGKQIFVNVEAEDLLGEYILLLPADRTVVEIVESVKPGKLVVEACHRLKKRGYRLALDNYSKDAPHAPLADLVDYVKVDFLATSAVDCSMINSHFSGQGIDCIAQKIETWESFRMASSIGYRNFQGHYFSKPEVLRHKPLAGSNIHHFKLLRELHATELNLEQLEETFKGDAVLTYKLLRYVNSAFFGWRSEIKSVGHALVLLGHQGIRRFGSLLVLARMGEGKPSELLTQAVIRARSCESLAEFTGLRDRDEELFLVGMLSLMDAIADCLLPEALRSLPISNDLKSVLLGKKSTMRDILQATIACEKGEWDALRQVADRLGLGEDMIAEHYLKAVEGVQQGPDGAALAA